MSAKSVAVLRGGPSTEYEVSMMTGKEVLSTLRKHNYKLKDIVIDRSGNWLSDGFVRKPENVLSDVDVVFLALHGAYGEDGTVQRIIERQHIPYTGSGPFASAVAFNKHLAKGYLKDSGIKMPKSLRLTRDGMANPVKTALSISEMFGPHYFLKPTAGGSSIDTRMVLNPMELASAINDLLTRHHDIVVEERIIGKEATVGVLEYYRGQRYYILPEIEIVPPAEAQFFSSEVKYNGATEEIVPGRFSRAEKSELAEAALNIHKILNLQQYSRSDFIVNRDGIYFLEVNTLPGLTSQSLFPKSIAALGSDFDTLVTHLVETASP